MTMTECCCVFVHTELSMMSLIFRIRLPASQQWMERNQILVCYNSQMIINRTLLLSFNLLFGNIKYIKCHRTQSHIPAPDSSESDSMNVISAIQIKWYYINKQCCCNFSSCWFKCNYFICVPFTMLIRLHFKIRFRIGNSGWNFICTLWKHFTPNLHNFTYVALFSGFHMEFVFFCVLKFRRNIWKMWWPSTKFAIDKMNICCHLRVLLWLRVATVMSHQNSEPKKFYLLRIK